MRLFLIYYITAQQAPSEVRLRSLHSQHISSELSFIVMHVSRASNNRLELKTDAPANTGYQRSRRMTNQSFFFDYISVMTVWIQNEGSVSRASAATCSNICTISSSLWTAWKKLLPRVSAGCLLSAAPLTTN